MRLTEQRGAETLVTGLLGFFSLNTLVDLFTAVSYTHLDVYKRQIMYAVCFYWRAWTFEPGMDFGASAWPQFIQGFAVACFFMPLTTITLSGLPPERLAAASSLSNFTRTLAGSIGTSITTTLWTNREALHHAQLTESVTPFNPNAQQIYDQLQGMGMTQQQASGWIAQQITNQGLIISANEIFWISAAIFILLLGLVWFARPPFSAGGGGGGAH